MFDLAVLAFAVLGAFGHETLRYRDSILKDKSASQPKNHWDRAFGLFLGLIVAIVVTGPIIALGDWSFGQKLPVVAPPAGYGGAIITGFFLQRFLSQTTGNPRD